jgi:steroid delta-isomerase-like uncharacterized protein
MKRTQIIGALGTVAFAGGIAGLARRRQRRADLSGTVRAHYAALEARDWERLAALSSEDVVYRDPEIEVRGRTEMVSRAKQLEAPFSDPSLETDIVTGNGGDVISEWRYSGIHSSALRMADGAIIPPSGERISVNGISRFVVKQGQIMEEHSFWDNEQFHSQIRSAAEMAKAGV